MAGKGAGKKLKSGSSGSKGSIALQKLIADDGEFSQRVAEGVLQATIDRMSKPSLSDRVWTLSQIFLSNIGDSALFSREVSEVTRADGTSEKTTRMQFGSGKLIVIFVVVLLLIALAF